MPLNLPPKISSIPFLGSALEYAQDPLVYYQNIEKKNHPICYDKLFNKYFFLVFEEKIAEEVFVKKHKNFVKNKFLKSFDEFFGNGLLVSDGEDWRRDRKRIQPMFSSRMIQGYTQKIYQVAQDDLKTIDTQRPILCMELMTKMTLRIILESVMGVPATQEVFLLLQEITEDFQRYFSQTTTPLGILTLKWPLEKRRKYLRGIEKFDSMIQKLIQMKNQHIQNVELGGTEETPRDLFSVILKSFDNAKDIRDQVLTFLIAGHETSANILSFALWELAQNPDYQDEIFQCINSEAELDGMNFLEQFILEVLRYYPTSALIARDALTSDNVFGHDIPASSMVTLPIYAIHRSSKYYNNPEIFNPRRWSTEFYKNLPKLAFIPFGYGPRACIGEEFAMMEFRIVLKEIVKNFTVFLEENHVRTPLKLKLTIMLKPESDFHIHFRPRHTQE